MHLNFLVPLQTMSTDADIEAALSAAGVENGAAPPQSAAAAAAPRAAATNSSLASELASQLSVQIKQLRKTTKQLPSSGRNKKITFFLFFF